MSCNSNWSQRVVIARTPTCPCRMRAGIRFRAAIARLLQAQPLSQPPSRQLFIRNQKTATEGSKTGKRSRRAPLTKKDLREELAEKWLLSLSSGESNATGGLKAEVAATLELCAAVDGGEEEVNSSGDAASYNGNVNGWVLGIDPDVYGAVAVLKPTDDSDSPVAQVYDIPTTQVFVGKRTRRRPDTRSIVCLIREMGIPKGSLAYIEQSLPFPTDGKQGWYGCGFGYGLWIGILVSFGISVIPISSVVWKKQFDLIGRTSCKDDSRVIACELFPHLSPQLKRKKDHGRAEALLIARYGRDSMNVST